MYYGLPAPDPARYYRFAMRTDTVQVGNTAFEYCVMSCSIIEAQASPCVVINKLWSFPTFSPQTLNPMFKRDPTYPDFSTDNLCFTCPFDHGVRFFGSLFENDLPGDEAARELR